MQELRRLWRENRLLVSAFVVALVLMVMFAVRTVAFWIYWADPAHRNQAIEPWMTPRYIAHSWDVPPRVVGEALGLNRGGPRVTMGELAEDRGISVETLGGEVVAAIRSHRSAREAAQ